LRTQAIRDTPRASFGDARYGMVLRRFVDGGDKAAVSLGLI
jgi:hypothetical protein